MRLTVEKCAVDFHVVCWSMVTPLPREFRRSLALPNSIDRMSTNPYESPATVNRTADSHLPNRRSALAAFRTAFVILLTPALFNYYAFDTDAIGGGIPPILQAAYRTTNLVGIAVGSFLIWFFALPVLEAASRTIRNVVARDASTDRWVDALYMSLKPAAYLAVPGAILWALWVVGFYFLQLDFVMISYGVGIPAHILAACLYVPLLIRWYRLSRSELPAQRHRTNG